MSDSEDDIVIRRPGTNDNTTTTANTRPKRTQRNHQINKSSDDDDDSDIEMIDSQADKSAQSKRVITMRRFDGNSKKATMDNDSDDDDDGDASFVDSQTESDPSSSDDSDNNNSSDGDNSDGSDNDEVKQPIKKQRTAKKVVELDENGDPIKKARAPRKPKLDDDGNPIEPKAKVVKTPKEKVVKEKVTKPSPKKKATVDWDAFDDADFDLTPVTRPSEKKDDGLNKEKTEVTTKAVFPIKSATTATTNPTPKKAPPTKSTTSTPSSSLFDQFDDADFDLTPAPVIKKNTKMTTTEVPTPIQSKSRNNVVDGGDDDHSDVEVQLPPPVPLNNKLTSPVQSQQQQQQQQSSSQNHTKSLVIDSTVTPSSSQPSSKQTTPNQIKPTKVSAYLDDDEDVTEKIETNQKGESINIFAKMMGGAKRKQPGNAAIIVKEKVIEKAPNKIASNFDEFDDDFTEFTSNNNKDKSNSQSTKTTPTTTTTKSSNSNPFGIKPTPVTATTTTTTKTPFTPSTITQKSTPPGPSNRTNDKDLWNLWGEPNFDPDNVSWLPGESIPYAAIASMFSKCEETRKRLLIISYVRDFYRAVIRNSPNQLLLCVYMTVNQVSPAFEGTELGIGDSILQRAITEATGCSIPGIKEKMNELGDLGLVAQGFKSKQSFLIKPKPLYCDQVFKVFREISQISGKSSQEIKRGLIKGLLANAQGNEVRFLIRAFQGNLRIGLALQTVLRSLAEAIVLTPPQYKNVSTMGNGDDDNLEMSDDEGCLSDSDVDDGDGDRSENNKKSTSKRRGGLDDDDEDADIIDEKQRDGRKAGSKKKVEKDAKKKLAKGKKSNDDDNDDEDSLSNFNSTTKNATPLQTKMQWAVKVIETAYNEGPSFDRLIPVLLEYPLSALKNHCMLTPGLPIKVMLGKPGTSVGFAVDKLVPGGIPKGKEDEALLSWEYKYDGERAQIHMLENGQVQIFSRHMEPYTSKYPDVIASLPTVMRSHTKTFIIDCEIVAWDVVKKKILPFQVLSTRKRKDVDADSVTIKVQLFPFDMLYYNGESLMKTEFIKRRELLHQAFKEIDGTLKFATYVDGQDEGTISSFLPQAIADSCEGLMAKPLYGKDSYYVPDKRKWIKLKKDYLEGVGDTIDLVILAAWNGVGKRTGFYGTYLYGIWDPISEQYQSMTCIGTGYKDKDLSELHEKLQEHIIDGPQENYLFVKDNTNPPDVWFEPKLVAEVKCADLTVSSDYMAAYGNVVDKDGNEAGVGMRFPRFLRLREDKPPTASTGPEQITEMYYDQASVQR